MHKLIMMTQGVMETKAIQFWYGILNKKLNHWVQNVMSFQPTQLTLANVF